MEKNTEISNAVLVVLSIREWQAVAQDKKVSADVCESNGVKDKRQARVWKSLFPKCPAVQKLQAVRRAARKFHYRNTLTWMHDGPRILTTANYDTYMSQMRKFRSEFEEALLDLIGQYPALKGDAKVLLAKLWDESLYPSADGLRERYSFEWKVLPLPATEGLLSLNLRTDDAEQLCDQLRDEMNQSFKDATRSMWTDLFQTVEKFVLKLQDGDAKVKAANISSVRELAALLPRLNIMGDEQLDIIAKRLTETLESVTEAKLEVDPEARRRLTSETQSVFNVMQAVMPGRTARAEAKPRTAALNKALELRRAA